jgi:hypothetical protein
MTDRSGGSRLDEAIERAARELTGGTPRAGFATRVQSRLGTKRASYAGWWQLAGAAAALALIFVLLPARAPQTPAPSSQARDTAPAGSGHTGAVVHRSEASRGGRTELERVAPPRRAFARPTTRVPLRVRIEQDAPQIAALPEIEDLSVAIDQPEQLAVSGLDVADLRIPPIDIDKKELQ